MEIFHQVVYAVIFAAATAVLAAIVRLIPMGVELLKSKVQGIQDETLRQKVSAAIDDLGTAATTVVSSLQQSTVAPLKAAAENGKLSQEDIAIITSRAVSDIRAIASDESQELLSEYSVDVSTLIQHLVQKEVLGLKNNTSLSAVAATINGTLEAESIEAIATTAKPVEAPAVQEEAPAAVVTPPTQADQLAQITAQLAQTAAALVQVSQATATTAAVAVE